MESIRLAVVVPTRNRADIAPVAVASILADDDARIQAIVSDNSTDEAQVERLRAELVDERVRYVRPAEGLPMTAHWQWALEQALADEQITHVLFLGDRRVLRPGALAEALAIVERYPATVLTFADDVIVRDEERPVRVAERPWTGALLRVDAAHLLRVGARGMHPVALPRMLNNIVPRAVFDDLTATFGDIFASIAPDHSFGYRVLDRVDSILYLDRVLVISHAMSRSNGYSQARGVVNADHADFMRELRGEKINQHAPVPELLTVTNAAYNEYEFVRAESASRKLARVPRHFYLGANARDVAHLAEPELRAAMEGVLREHGWSPWMRARYVLGLALSAAGAYARRPGALLAHLRRRPAPPAEFADPAAALAYALEAADPPSAEAHHLWPLLSRPRAARALVGYPPEGLTAGRAALASVPRNGRPTRESTPAGP